MTAPLLRGLARDRQLRAAARADMPRRAASRKKKPALPGAVMSQLIARRIAIRSYYIAIVTKQAFFDRLPMKLMVLGIVCVDPVRKAY
jgi:hypothetical protein